MTQSNTSAIAKLSVAFVAVAMLLSMAAPAKAATIEELQAMIAQLTAQLAALSGGSSTTGGSYTFTRSLTIGAQGDDVKALQNFLIGKGFGIPAGATAYFGAQTAAALAKFQAANGITPAVGYFGPKTMASINGMMGGSTGGSSTGTSGLSGTAGSVSISTDSSDIESDVAAGQSHKVVGFRVQATGSDVKVTNLGLRIETNTNNTSGASSYLDRYVGKVYVYADGQVVGSIDASDFVRDASGDYSATLPISNAIVKMGNANRVTFQVGVKAPSVVSSDEDGATFKVTARNLRFVDASGAILTESTVNNATVTLNKTASNEKVIIAAASSNPKGSVATDEDNATEIDLLAFTVKAQGDDVKFDKAVVTATTMSLSNGGLTNIYLYRGTTKVADLATTSVSSGGNITLNLYDQDSIADGSTKTYRVVGKFAKDTKGTVKMDLSSINPENSAGNSVTSSGSAAGETLTLISTGLTVSDFSASATQTTDSGKVLKENITYSFKVTAKGNTFYIPKVTTIGSATSSNADGSVIAVSGPSDITSTSSELSSSAALSNNRFTVNDGETKTFTGTVSISAGTTTGFVRITLDDVLGATTNSANTMTFSAGQLTPTADFQSIQYTIY